MTVPPDRPAYLAVARYAPWAFTAALVFFIVMVLLSLGRGEMDWYAFAVALTLLPAVVVTRMDRELIVQLVREATARH